MGKVWYIDPLELYEALGCMHSLAGSPYTSIKQGRKEEERKRGEEEGGGEEEGSGEYHCLYLRNEDNLIKVFEWG